MAFAPARHAAPAMSLRRRGASGRGLSHLGEELAEIGVERARKRVRSIERERDLSGLDARQRRLRDLRAVAQIPQCPAALCAQAANGRAEAGLVERRLFLGLFARVDALLGAAGTQNQVVSQLTHVHWRFSPTIRLNTG